MAQAAVPSTSTGGGRTSEWAAPDDTPGKVGAKFATEDDRKENVSKSFYNSQKCAVTQLIISNEYLQKYTLHLHLLG